MTADSRKAIFGSSRMLLVGFGVLLAVITVATIVALTMASLDGAVQEGSAAHGVLLASIVLGVAGLAAGSAITVLVTRRVKHTESEFELEKEFAQVSLHSIGDGVITTNAEGRVSYLNPIAERYTEWLTAEARGTSCCASSRPSC